MLLSYRSIKNPNIFHMLSIRYLLEDGSILGTLAQVSRLS